MVLFRVRLNRPWFGIYNKILNFHYWTLCYIELLHDNTTKWKSMNLSMDLWHSNNMKVIFPNFAKDHCFWTLWTPNFVDCISLSCIDYFQILFSNFQKTWLNLQLYGRNPIKSVLFICPSVCLMHFPQDLLSAFFNFFAWGYFPIYIKKCPSDNLFAV